MRSPDLSLLRKRTIAGIPSRDSFPRHQKEEWLIEIGLEDLSIRDIAARILEAKKKELVSHAPSR